MANYEDMTKEELQEELADRDLPVSGNKDELVARLELDDAEGDEETTDGATPDEIVAAQVKDPSGQRDPEKNPPANAVAGPENEALTAEEEAAASEKGSYRESRELEEKSDEDVPMARSIQDHFEDPEPHEVGRERTQQDQFDYRVLPDGRRQKLVFEGEDEEDDEE